MTIDYDHLMSLVIPDVGQTFTRRDIMVYALGVGLGADPLDPRQLAFVYEEGLQALPTFPAVLADPGFWMRDLPTGIDWRKVVHGEHELTLHRPLPVEGEVRSATRILDVVDKGEGKGAIIRYRRDIFDAQSGDLLASMDDVVVCRGDGGFGGPQRSSAPRPPLPDRAPDVVLDLPVLPQAALIYRLSGDYNPLHADPAAAKAAGFERPILHGLATVGIAGHAILRACCDYDPSRLASIAVRFSAPAYPGETISTEIHLAGEEIAFRAVAKERGVVVLQGGRARLI